eukprot:6955511-Karenia_brevis.AAC.1
MIKSSLDLRCGPNARDKRGKCMFEDQKMNHCLSREKKQAHRTTTSEVCVHPSRATAFMPEVGAIRNEEAK